MNNFTPRAQQVLALARKEADRFNHNTSVLSTSFWDSSSWARAWRLTSCKRWVSIRDGADGSGETGRPGPETKMVGNDPYTPRVKKVLALAGKEAKALNHSYVGTEHILLGLLREGEGVAREC